MIYKDFIAETAQKIMASVTASEILINEMASDDEDLKKAANGSVIAAKLLADALEEDFKEQPVDGGVKRYAETETFFDNYVNWTKTK